MIRRLFIYLTVVLSLLCFITSCKKDSPIKETDSENTDNNKPVSKNKKENLVIRDDKTNDTDTISEINSTNEPLSHASVEQVAEEPSEGQEENASQVYDVAEHLPEFPGGLESLNKYLNEQTHAVKAAAGIKRPARAMISFIVEKDGSLTSPSVAKSSGVKVLDSEAIRIVLQMPAWTPARSNGENIRMKYLVPVTFNPAK